MVIAGHALIATASLAALWRGLARGAFAESAPDSEIASALSLAVAIASAAGSVGAIVAGRTAWSPFRAIVLDLTSLAGAGWALGVLSLAPWTRELGGVIVIVVMAMRLAPATAANDYLGDRYRALYPVRLPDMHAVEVA